MSEISNRIKSLREEKNLSQTKMAAEIAVKRHHVVDIESDKQRPPYETIIKYAEYFSVNADWLLTGMGEKYAKADVLKEPVPGYGGGILENMAKKEDDMQRKMDFMIEQIMKLNSTVAQLEKKLEAA